MAYTTISNGDVPDATILMANFAYILALLSAGKSIAKYTTAELTAAATGTDCFLAWDTDKKTLYLWPGDAAIGLIVMGGAAAGPIADIDSTERG